MAQEHILSLGESDLYALESFATIRNPIKRQAPSVLPTCNVVLVKLSFLPIELAPIVEMSQNFTSNNLFNKQYSTVIHSYSVPQG